DDVLEHALNWRREVPDMLRARIQRFERTDRRPDDDLRPIVRVVRYLVEMQNELIHRAEQEVDARIDANREHAGERHADRHPQLRILEDRELEALLLRDVLERAE